MSSPRSYYADASLRDFLADLWRARLFIMGGVLAGMLSGYVMLGQAVPQYKASMIIAPLASSPDAQPYDFARFETILRGASVAGVLQRDPILMAGLAADKRWRWAHAPEIGNAAYLAAFLEDEIEIMPVTDSGLRRVTYDHPDPAFAPLLLGHLYDAAERVIRQERQADAAQRIEHFTQTLRVTEDPVQRRSLTEKIRAEEETRVMLDGAQPYAATLAEPPAAEAEPAWPRPWLIYGVLVFIGAFLGFALHVLRRDPSAAQ